MKYGFIDVPTIYFFEEKNIFTGSCLEDFRKYVTAPFVSEYISGRTPSPCVFCNKLI